MSYTWALFICSNLAIEAMLFSGLSGEIDDRHWAIIHMFRRWMGVEHHEDFTDEEYQALRDASG